MNGSIASANNATLATVAANYGLKTVVDQHSLRHSGEGGQLRRWREDSVAQTGWQQRCCRTHLSIGRQSKGQLSCCDVRAVSHLSGTSGMLPVTGC